MIKVILKSITAEGFGGEAYYKEVKNVKEINPDVLRRIKIDFALKYGVELDSISAEVIK